MTRLKGLASRLITALAAVPASTSVSTPVSLRIRWAAALAARPIETTDQATATTAPTPADRLTRDVCAAAYVQPTLRTLVHRLYLDQPRRAWAPTPPLHLPTVLRHTRLASRAALVRDAVLCALLTTDFVLAIIETTHGGWAAASVLVGGVASTWLVIVGFGIWQHLHAVRLLTHADWYRHGPRLPAVFARRAEDVARGNVVVFGRRRDSAPFVGSGKKLTSWSVVVNVANGRILADGPPCVPQPVDVLDLLNHIATTADVGSPSHQYRLYVNGTGLRDTRLLPDGPAGPPTALLPEEAVREYVRNPDGDRRGYLSLESTDRYGTVVTLLARARLVGLNLYFETNLHILPAGELLPMVAADELPRRRLVALRAALVQGAREYGRLLVGSPGRLAQVLIGAWRRSAQRRWISQTDHPAGFDYGAAASLSEALLDGQPLQHFIPADAIGTARLLQDIVVDALEHYLTDRDINLRGVFDRIRFAHTVVNRQSWDLGGSGDDLYHVAAPPEDEGDQSTAASKPAGRSEV